MRSNSKIQTAADLASIPSSSSLQSPSGPLNRIILAVRTSFNVPRCREMCRVDFKLIGVFQTMARIVPLLQRMANDHVLPDALGLVAWFQSNASSEFDRLHG